MIVVDNASHDDSLQLLARFPQVRVIANPDNRGFAVANNQAFAVSRGELIMPINPDTEIVPGCLEQLVAFLRAHPRAGLASPVVAGPDGRFAVPLHGFTPVDPPMLLQVALRRLRPRAPLPERPMKVDWLWSTGFVCRRAALRGDTLFDEDMFLFCEEYGLDRAIRDAGFELWVVPDARLVHHTSVTWNRDPERLSVARRLGMAALWNAKRKEFGVVVANLNQLVHLVEAGSIWTVVALAGRLGRPRPLLAADYRAQASASWRLLRDGDAYVRAINDRARRFFNAVGRERC